jgi:pilus assembly protein CpaB
MKKYGALVALGLAVLFGIVAVFLVNRWLTTQSSVEKPVATEQIPTASIVVAAQDLDIGTPLSTKTLTLAQWPKANTPKGAFSDIAKVEGRVAVSKIYAGQPLLAAELADPGSGAGLVALIPKGKRAMTIRVDEVIGVAGFVLPNTFVDVIAVGNQDNHGRLEARTILKKIKVLAIAQETATEEGKAKVVRTVTMELTPKEAEQLALQTHEGSIHLVLRNPLEEEVAEEPPPPPKKVVRARRVPTLQRRVQTVPLPTFEVEVVRGSEQKGQSFQFKPKTVSSEN